MGPDELYKSERVCGVSFPNPPLSPTLNGSSPSATRLPTPNTFEASIPNHAFQRPSTIQQRSRGPCPPVPPAGQWDERL